MNVHQYIKNPLNNTKEKETTANLTVNTINAAIELSYHITLYKYPIDNTFDINIPLQGTHFTLGTIL